MATTTLGTAATDTLTAMLYKRGATVADFATIAANIKDDENPNHPIWPGAFEQNGILVIPRRGIIQVLPGDYVAFDDTGWPILVSANSIANGSSWDVP